MLRTRLIPSLLLHNEGLVKTKKFKDPRYLGDPINTIKIFNEKEVDELVFLDITASTENRQPNFTLLTEIASECFMPLGYGGGISNLEEVKRIFYIGIEKVIINSSAYHNPRFIENIAKEFGNQSLVLSMDAKKNFWGKYKLYSHSGKKKETIDLVSHAKNMENLGVGEILLNSIDNDGMMKGYDLKLVQEISSVVSIPVVACGGAGKLDDFIDAINIGGASAVAAGSYFVYQGKHNAVLMNYPSYTDIETLQDKIRTEVKNNE